MGAACTAAALQLWILIAHLDASLIGCQSATLGGLYLGRGKLYNPSRMGGQRRSCWRNDVRIVKAFFILIVWCLLSLSGWSPIQAQRPTMPGGYQLPDYLQPITLTPVFGPEPLLRAAGR